LARDGIVGDIGAFGLAFPEHDRRVEMLEEALEVIRLLWSGEPVSFAGRWYRLEEAQLQPTPEQLWIGVGGR
jgi:alkanesulfonate monooxygenase SsuD/methylene tetrahydromethanopterin reductase-like flavin-dependent oxidoreductase (luciferase family)